MTPQTRPGTLRLALLLGALAMFGPFAIDTLFPAFPAIASDFAATPLALQQTITAYLLAYGVMSLLHGPLSDVFGRRRVILTGVALFGLASVGCALSRSLPELLFYRALQGMSAGGGLIVGRAIIRDCCEGDAAQRLMALVSMVFSIAPAIAPIIGGWILGVAAWPMIFWVLAGFSAALWLVTALALPETHPPALRQPLHLRSLLRENAALLRNRQLLRLGFAGGCNFAALFLYIASAPVFVIDHLGLNAQQFGWFFVPMIAGMALGAFTNSQLAGRWQAEVAIRFGFACSFLAALANLMCTAWLPPQAPWSVLPISLNAFGIAIVFPILMLAILDMYPRQRGAASSMQQVLGLSVNTLVAGLLSPLLSPSLWALALGSAGLSLLGWLLWRSYRRRVMLPPAAASAEQLVALEPTERL